jgi:hypothetical protein
MKMRKWWRRRLFTGTPLFDITVNRQFVHVS